MKVARVVFRNAIFNFASLVVGNISGLFLVIIIARILKPDYFGIYSLTIAIANVLIAITNLGIDGAVIRYTAYFSKDVLRVRSHLRYFLKIKVLLAFSVSTILFFTSDKLANVFGDERLALTFAVASLIVVFASLTNVLNSFFMGLQEFRYTFFRQIVYEISRWIFILPLSMIFLAVGAVLGTALAYLAAFLFLVVIIFKFYREYFVGGVENVSEGVKSFMGFMTIASISGIIYAYVDSIMIGYLLTPTDVGYYRAAYSIVFAIVGLIASLGRVLLPTFTQLSIDE
ncbi:oligosaccharide flippase family protein, partial [Archaeoglobus sp.]